MNGDNLSGQSLERYARNISLPKFGQEGQQKLKQSAALIVGLGGLGSTTAMFLAGAGVGRIGLLDDDVINLSNLPRQVLYFMEDIGEPKALTAKKALSARNPEVTFELHATKLDTKNALEIIKGYDIVLDGTDNLAARNIINRVCAALGKPYIYGAVNLFDGQVSVFWAKHGPCLSCLFPLIESGELTEDDRFLGVLSTLPGVVSTIQATEALKLITGIGSPLIGRLLMIDGLNADFRTIEIPKRENCPICGA